MQTQTGDDTFKPDFGFTKATSKLLERVWTRREHGKIPVSVWETETRGLVYELERKEGSEFYRSARRLLKAITGRAQTESFDRYFRADNAKVSGEKLSVAKVLDESQRRVVVPRVKGELRETKPVIDTSETQFVAPEIDFGFDANEFHTTSDGLKLTDGANEHLVRQLVASFDGLYEEIARPELGIDLAERGHEVRKLLFKGFRGLMFSRGYDPEDVLQEIYRGLLTRNAGKCPWDGRKSTFGFYVTMVCRCVLTNYHRKQSRRLDRQAMELDEAMLDGQRVVDPSDSSDRLAQESLEKWLTDPKRGGDTPDGRLAVEILPLVGAGYQRREIIEATGERETLVSRALAHLRKWSKEWAAEMGLEVRERRRVAPVH